MIDVSYLRSVEDALMNAINTSRVPALTHLAVPPYRRELRTYSTPEGGIALCLYKCGYRSYKARPRKTPPPPADTAAIRNALNNAINSHFHVLSVIDKGQYVQIILEENMKKFFLESLKDTATNLAAESAAKYKIYLERENAAAREAAKNSANQMKIVGARNFAWAYYYAVLEILYTAILNVFPQIYMFPLRSAKQLIAPTIVGISDQGYYYFVFRGWYKRGYVTAPDMQQTLQSEIDALTSTVYRFPRLRIAVTFGENGRVIFRIAFEADVKGALT